MSGLTDVLVVGGGVQGASIAYHLSRDGVKVTLLEKYDIAAAASGASAGGIRHQGRDLREFPLAFRAIERWASLEAELAANVQYRRGGHLTTIEEVEDLPTLTASVAAQREAGLEIELVLADRLGDLCPGISSTVIAAAYTPNDGHANPTETTRAFAAAAARHGATIDIGHGVDSLISSGDRITGVRTAGGALEADLVILAAGAWSIDLAASVGITVPIIVEGYQAMTSAPAPHVLDQVMGSYRRRISLKQLPDGRFLYGGGWPGEFDLNTPRGRTLDESRIGNVEAARGILPAAGDPPIEQAWLGIEAVAADEVPIIGPIDGVDGLIVTAGFSGHGFALAPAVGESVATLVRTGAVPPEIEPLTHSRFAHGTPTTNYPVQKVG